MDVQLQELIDKIKSDGVASAEKEAAEIVQAAEEKAETIVKEAQQKAADLISEAERSIEQMERSGKEALAQSGRDLILSLQARITALFDELISTQASDALTGSALVEIVPKVLASWKAEGSEPVDVLLSESDLNTVEVELRGKLAELLKGGVELRATDGVDAGFRISEKDGSAYYDFTPGEIAAALGEYLNPRLNEILRQASAK